MEFFKAPTGLTQVVPRAVTLRCPACRQVGTFEGNLKNPDTSGTNGSPGSRFLGLRRCPNFGCHVLVFVVVNAPGVTQATKVLESYPPEVIDFDASHLPAAVLVSLEEAIACHAAGAYRAAVLMLRRALEEVCEDQGATGRDLHSRIEQLREKAVLPAGFIDGMHDLRLLGGDAAHVELRWFDQVDKAEAEDAIEILKFLLTALYQSTSVMARLSQRKRNLPADRDAP